MAQDWTVSCSPLVVSLSSKLDGVATADSVMDDRPWLPAALVSWAWRATVSPGPRPLAGTVKRLVAVPAAPMATRATEARVLVRRDRAIADMAVPEGKGVGAPVSPLAPCGAMATRDAPQINARSGTG